MFSTDNVWVGENTDKCLTNELTSMNAKITNRATVSHSHENYAEKTATINVKNTQHLITLTSGTGSVETDAVFVEGGKYLVSIKYTSGNALVDQSLYVFTYSTANRLCSTFNLVKCNNSTDSLLATQVDGVVTFATSYNGTGATAATLYII